ncbi:MAG TPA: hypothetical protein VLK82_12585 [Candidatus Tectomicrobia bacterium]|nr:hypothetical protein [Candidatus Tectomicrobia bacterium]
MATEGEGWGINEEHGQYAEHQNRALAACDRLIATLERALRLEHRDAGARDDKLQEPIGPYVVAQLRMRVRPALVPGWLARDPVHLTLFGGTNSGKSTVLNLLLGCAAAGMHATARFSQHPEAYRHSTLGDQWLIAAPSRFAAYQFHRNRHPPRQSDDELAYRGYRPAFAVLDPARLGVPALTQPAAAAVFWDAPDFSTEEAQTYIGAVLDVIALADVAVMTVTEESYADHRGILLFRMVRDSGVTLRVIANKLGDSPELLSDIAHKLHANWPGGASSLPPVPLHRLPLVDGSTPEERLRNLLATPEAAALRQVMAHEVTRGLQLKRQALAGAIHFIQNRLEEVLRPLVAEVEMAAAWGNLVERLARDELLQRYQREYLDGEWYGEFNQTLVRLMDLLEVPGIGPFIRLLSTAVRTPFRLASGVLRRLFGAGKVPSSRLPEQQVLDQLMQHWLAILKSEAQSLASAAAHPAWAEVVHRLEKPEFFQQLTGSFESAYGAYRQGIDAEIKRHAEDIYHAIEQRPWLLNTLRGTNLAVDTATIVLVIKSGGLNWSDAVVGPIVAGLRHTLLEAGLDKYLQAQQGLLKRQQFKAMQAMVERQLSQPTRDLFRGTARAEELEAVRRDFELVRDTTLRLVREDVA